MEVLKQNEKIEKPDTIQEEPKNVEEHFEEESSFLSGRAQPWTRQITVRGVLVSIVMGALFSVIVTKLNLATGIVPNLNVAAALLAFACIEAWTRALHKAGFVSRPFTRQENTMIQTCIVACYSTVAGGGFSSYLLALDKKTYLLSGVNTQGNSPKDIKEPAFGWMTGYQFVTCFVGLFVLIPLRKVMIIDLKLAYPSGLATAVLINGFHARGDKMAKKQVGGFMKYFSFSFIWAFFQWFYTGKSQRCGFSQFPTFGLDAWKNTFFFDFSSAFVGAGMIVSHLVNVSLLLGSVLSYGIMWPLIDLRKGDWFPASLDENSMESLNGYKVFSSVALILGDGLYNAVKILISTIIDFRSRLNEANRGTDDERKQQKVAELKHNEIFLRETIPMWIWVTGYIGASVLSTVVVPIIFPQLKWYYIVAAYVLAPVLAFCNAYGAGLTDMNLAFNYGKVALFVLAALSGKENGLVAALVGCGLVKSVISVACVLMQDFKTAHLTGTSPRAMLLSQVIGTLIGCITAPLSFFLFYNVFDVGNPTGDYKAPYALIYRNLAILGVEGFSALPHHCLQLCYGFFALAVLINLVRDLGPRKIGKWMPLPMVMAMPFLVGASYAIDMCIGSLIVFAWQKMKSEEAELMVPAVASGLICGEGLWTLPAAALALAKVKPPICMQFVKS